ncbi:MAG TPA: hypothetical protein VF902_06515 [Coriobacteriia bacterium]
MPRGRALGLGQGRFVIVLVIVSGVLAACSSFAPQPGAQRADDTPPWKIGASGVVVTAAPDAGGPLSFRNCPTLPEARAIVATLVSGPDANAVPFKTMVLTCNYTFDELDVQGRPAAISILVFDASAEGARLWESVMTDPQFPNPVDVPGIADVAFSTGAAGQNDLWVVQEAYGLHMYHTRPRGVPLEQMAGLARAMLTGLSRAAR